MKIVISAILLCLTAMQAWAGVAVIVHPANGDAIDKKAIENIYLGKTKSLDRKSVV